MASNSERTFGSRLTNAESLTTHLSGFVNYEAVRPEDSIVNFDALIDVVKTNNTLVSTRRTLYSNAVENRLKMFYKNPDSLARILTLIAGQVRAKFGRSSKETKDLSTLISKIRGKRNDKLKKDDEGEFVSQSSRSFGSQTAKFDEIIAKLTQFGTDYAPSNGLISVASLNVQYIDLVASNKAVAEAWNLLKPAMDKRVKLYDELSLRAIRIKDAVLTQNGIESSEYALVKGLKI